MNRNKKKAKREIPTSRRMALNAGARLKYLIRFAVGAVFLCWAGWHAYFGIDSLAWPIVNASILSTADKSSIFQETKTLTYQYQVGPVTYTAGYIRFGDSLFWNSYEDLAPLLASGDSLTARYNPDSPGMSCLIPGYHKLGVYIPLAIGCFFMIVGGIELRSRYLIR